MVRLKRIKGTTFDGFTIKAPFSLIGYTVKCDFKITPFGGAIFSYGTADGTLTIANDTLTFTPRILAYNAGIYKGDIKVISPNGDTNVWTEIIFEITQNITQ